MIARLYPHFFCPSEYSEFHSRAQAKVGYSRATRGTCSAFYLRVGQVGRITCSLDRPAADERGFALKIIFALFMLLLLAGAGVLFAWQARRGQEQLAGTAYVRSIVDDDALTSDPSSHGSPNTVSATSSHGSPNRDSDTFDSQSPASPATKSRHRPRDFSAPGGESWLSHFELIERSGETIRSEDLKGQPYVVGFFFTLCPSICVNQNAKVKELQEKFRGQPVRLLSISCDPDVDRPEVLREYAQRFEADPEQWLFLTGDLGYITRVAGEMYFLAASLRFHAEKFVLVDAEGNNVGYYTWNDPLQFQELERDIQKLLDGQPVQRETVNAQALKS